MGQLQGSSSRHSAVVGLLLQPADLAGGAAKHRAAWAQDTFTLYELCPACSAWDSPTLFPELGCAQRCLRLESSCLAKSTLSGQQLFICIPLHSHQCHSASSVPGAGAGFHPGSSLHQHCLKSLLQTAREDQRSRGVGRAEHLPSGKLGRFVQKPLRGLGTLVCHCRVPERSPAEPGTSPVPSA